MLTLSPALTLALSPTSTRARARTLNPSPPQAGAEVSALLGRIPSAVGYQPTLATDMGGLQERITTTQKGSITSVQAIYVPADDLTDPAPATTFSHLDATTVLSRGIAEKVRALPPRHPRHSQGI